MESSNGPRMSVPDLGALGKPVELPEEMRKAAMVAGELRMGLRCAGCEKRVHHGFQLAVLAAGYDPQEGKGRIDAQWITVCNDPQCGFGPKLVVDGKATAMREVRHKFFDELANDEEVGPDGH